MTPAFPASQLHLLSGEGDLACYQFNTRVARHYFCRHCGIYTFHETRTAPGMLRANIGCLEGIDPYAMTASVADGQRLSVVEDA